MTTCVSCAQALPEGARFCLHCGQEQTAPACSSCGATLVAGARFCMECGTPTAAPAATAEVSTPVASRRMTSILFGDLVGFTTLSESRDTEDVRELLARYFDESRRIVERYGGTIEKFIGDAVMAVWGVPVSQEDDAERAVRAGLELVAAVAQFGEEVGAPDLAMRVGVVTGEVAVTVGATQQGMVAGDPVNTAARVQSAASPGQVWVDETTRLLTTAAISYVDVGSHPLKGKADPVPLWSVRAVVAAVGGAQRADGLEAPLVGRDRELRLIKELFHRAEETSRPSLLVVEGEAGVGKSRLGWELEKYIDGLTKTVRWHSGRCVAYGEGVAHFAIAEAVRGRLRALTDDPDVADEEDVATQLERGLERFVPEADRDWIRPRLGALLGIGSVGTFAREELFGAWTSWFEAVGAEAPVALVVDDGQFADEGTLQFLEHLLSQGRFACFLLLLTRSGLLASRPTLITRPGANVIHLDTLSPTDMAQMFEGLVPALPPDARAQLVERAEGVPLFAVETVRSLIDRDLVVPRGGEYVLADGVALDADAMTAPASLHALVAARLDTLSPDQRYVVDRASVLGLTFTPEALAGVCPDVPDLDAVLAQLVHLQILSLETSRISSEYGQYRFVQSVVRQVAYGTLSRHDRKAVHLAVVNSLESAEGHDLAAIQAQHYLDALHAVPDAPDAPDLRAHALANLRDAATRARALGSPAEGARHLQSALDLADEPATRANVLCDLAYAELDAAHYQASIDHGREAVDQLEALGDRVGAAKAAAILGTSMAAGLGHSEQALQLMEPWWEELKDHEEATETLLLLTRAITVARTRVKRPIHDVLEARMRLSERTGAIEQLTESYNLLAVHYNNVGAPSVGSLLLHASADLARRHHQMRTLGLTLVNIAAGELSGNVDQAVEAAREAAAVSAKIGDPLLERFALANLAIGLWTAGAWDDLDEVDARSNVETLIDETVEAMLAYRALVRGTAWQGKPLTRSDSVDDDVINGWRAFLESIVGLIEGDPATALARGMDSVRLIYGASGVWDDLAHLWGPVAELAVDAGADDELAELMVVVDDNAIHCPVGLLAHRAYIDGLVAARDGEDAEVERLLREATERYDAWGAPIYSARARSALGRWLTTQGRPDEAAPLLDQARATYTSLGATRWLTELDQAAVGS